MSPLQPVTLNDSHLEEIRKRYVSLENPARVLDHGELASWVISYGLQREIGTVNDELARFIFNPETGQPVALTSLKAEIVRWNRNIGVRVRSTESDRLETRVRGLLPLSHPDLTFNVDGSVRQLVFFPEMIARIAALESVDLVMPRPWAMNSIFGGFDPAKAYYQTNYWELANNDTVLFASLLEEQQLAFLGTHDLIAHIAGIKRSAFEALKPWAHETRQTIIEALRETRKPSLSALVLPYCAGVVLDDLAQPPNYGSEAQERALKALLKALRLNGKSLQRASTLLKFPASFENVIRISRDSSTSQSQLDLAIETLISETLRYSLA